MNERYRDMLIVPIAVLVLGVLMGGMYSVPAMRVTSCRDPWLTILLGVGLSVTVGALGFAFGLTFLLIVGTWIFAWALLLVRRFFGKLDHNLERFGLVHAATLVGVFCLGWFAG
jgi:hypothetical protein